MIIQPKSIFNSDFDDIRELSSISYSKKLDVTWLSDHERKMSKDKDQGWHYTINTHAFRDEEFDSESDKPIIAFYGCSNTFGVGVSNEHCFPRLVKEKFLEKYRVYNFGSPGSSCERIARIFDFTVYHLPIKAAFICFPPGSRTFFHQGLGYYDLLSNPPWPDGFKKFAKTFYRHMYYEHFKYQMIRSIDSIINSSRVHNCPHVIANSWDSLSNDLIKDTYASEIETYFGPLKFIDRGRDHAHPGIQSHKYYARDIIKYIQKNV